MKLTNNLIAVLILSLGISSTKTLGAPRNQKFKAKFSTEFYNAAFDPNTGLFTTVVEGGGRARYMGKTTFSAQHTFAFTTPDLTAGIAWDGELQLTAANGDLLNGTYVGDIVLSNDPDYPFLLIFDVTFIGGTGRFASATGTATVTGLTTIEPDLSNGLFKGTSEFVFDGTIQFNRSGGSSSGSSENSGSSGSSGGS